MLSLFIRLSLHPRTHALTHARTHALTLTHARTEPYFGLLVSANEARARAIQLHKVFELSITLSQGFPIRAVLHVDKE